MDHVAIIDDMAVLAGGGASPCQGHQQRAADEQLQTVIIQPDPQAMADEPGRHRVEHLLEREAARGGDGDDRLLIIAGPLPGQRLKRGPLGRDAFGVVGVLAADDLVDERAIARQIIEVAGTAHQQRVPDGLLKMAMRLSIAPFSCATPRLLRVGCIPKWAHSAS